MTIYQDIDLPLKTLHLSARYEANTDDLVNLLSQSFKKILNVYDNKKELRYLCHEKFYTIVSASAQHNKYLQDKKAFKNMCEDLSFSNIFKDKKFANVGEYLDSLAFKIYDYAFCDTREQQMDRYHKVFGDSSYRTIQIFFAQKGQLWLLNMLNNVAEWAGGKSQKEIDEGLKDFLRDAVDKDFSPYHDKTSKEKMDKIIQDLIEKGKKATKKCKEGTEIPSTFKVKENRMLGFELEAQFKDKKADEIFNKMDPKKDNIWHIALHRVYKAFKNSNDKKLKKTAILCKEGAAVIEKGTIIREGSVIRENGYTVFEYASPIAKNGIQELKQNVNAFCDVLHKNGTIVTDDAGTHLHVSIEDILPKEKDDEKTKKEKLEAAKRIFINYILIQDKIEQIIPEHRRSDHFWFSSQTFESYVNGNKDLIIGLFDSAESYEDLREAIMAGGKYIPIAPYKNNVEFRCFPATTSAETMNTWFELLNTFVNNSIKGLPAEKCLDEKLYSKLQDLTKNGTYVEGRVGTRDYALDSCNSFKVFPIPQKQRENILEYAREVVNMAFRDDMPGHAPITSLPVAITPDRKPGERPETEFPELDSTNDFDEATIKRVQKHMKDKIQQAKNNFLGKTDCKNITHNQYGTFNAPIHPTTKLNKMLVLGKGNFKNSLDTYTPMTKINKKFNTILENEVANISPIQEKSKTFVEKYLERNNKQQQNTFNI